MAYLSDHGTDAGELMVTVITDPMRLCCPFAILVDHLLLLVPATPAYVLGTSFALVDTLQLPMARGSMGTAG